MKKMMNLFTLSIVFGTFLIAGNGFSKDLKVDQPHSNIVFLITHQDTNKVYGQFHKFDVDVNFEEDGNNNSVNTTIQVGSIDTDNSKRDNHLKSPDFFEVAKYPTISFKSTSFVKARNNIYKVQGNFTMHGVTKKITMYVKATKNRQDGYTFTANLNIKRSDYGIDFGLKNIGDKVTIKISIATKG